MIVSNELFKTPGRPKSDPDDIAARRRAFQKLRKALAMDRNELAKVTGLSARSIGHYMAPPSSKVAATWTTIDAMHEEAIRRAKAAVSIAEDRLFRAEIELQDLERMEVSSSIKQPPCAYRESGSAFL